ncbi:hypothetical protein OVA11_06440 [Caulobacter sp. SL161]|uniref:hypothetical protein n=1 Tax=Caulobacter sp. SL161 TaxID=2995156 RepID=UPI0022765DDD|nr:hypothetical protein [Caulobacter sp. SL161]MCY1646723.1 hypothetical protein [Caulobacter sp. SL161]
MAGMACLRICIEHGARSVTLDGVTPAKIDKVASGYIDVNWRAPRRHGRVGAGAYVLIDPSAATLDGEELRRMAAELQVHLFGTQGQQDLCMLTFEGDEEQVLKFTTLPEEELLAMRSGGEPPPPEGRTRLVSQDGVRELAPWGSTPRVSAQQAKAEDAAPVRLGWRGVYSLPTQRFEATQIQPFQKPGEPEPQADADFTNRDLIALDRAVAAQEGDPRLRAWVGVRLWSVARGGLRETCAERFAAIPTSVRERLGAMVYDAPRDLPFSTIGPLRDVVQPHFARVGLSVNDPGFNVQALPEALAFCVIFQLPEEDEKARLLKAHRFLSARSQYVGRKVRMGLGGVKAPRELELAHKMGAHIVKGPLISALFATPVAEQALPLTELPLRT